MTAYLTGYFGVGAALFVVVLVVNRLALRNEAKRGPLTSPATAGWRSHRFHFMDDLLVPVLGTAFVVTAWPVVAYWKVREWMPAGGTKEHFEKRAFTVAQEHLGRAVTLDEIERMERVHDPLGAVPDLPFGHLHEAWRRYTAQMQPGDALWTFSADWKDDWGRLEHRSGYVIVTAEGPNNYFLTSRRRSRPNDPDS